MCAHVLCRTSSSLSTTSSTGMASSSTAPRAGSGLIPLLRGQRVCTSSGASPLMASSAPSTASTPAPVATGASPPVTATRSCGGGPRRTAWCLTPSCAGSPSLGPRSAWPPTPPASPSTSTPRHPPTTRRSWPAGAMEATLPSTPAWRSSPRWVASCFAAAPESRSLAGSSCRALRIGLT